MAQWHRKSKRKATGALLNTHRKKKKYERGRDFLPANIGESRIVARKSKKRTALSIGEANILSNGKIQKTKILSVAENRADAQFIRRNILTKGAVVETELGKARITSRPGQHGIVNAVTVEKNDTQKGSQKK